MDQPKWIRFPWPSFSFFKCREQIRAASQNNIENALSLVSLNNRSLFFCFRAAMHEISTHPRVCLSLKWFDYVAGSASLNCKLSRPSWKLLLFAHWQNNLEYIFGLIQPNLICFTMPSGSHYRLDAFSI